MAIKIASLDAHADGTLVVPNKLGIGTSTPIYAILDVAGNINIRGDGYLNIGSSGYGDVSIRPTGSGGGRGMSFWTYNGAPAQKVTIDLNGNVGIGTSSPSSLLHIYGSTTDVYAMLQNASTGGRQWIFNATSNASGEGGGRFLIKDGTASATRLAIDSSGNVGIGTTSPSVPLEVKGTVTSNNGSYNTQIWLGRNANAYSGITFRGAIAYDMGVYTKPSDDNIYIGKWGGSGTWADMHVITSSGAVGIGTTNPSNMLAIAGETAQFPASLYIAPTGHATSRRAAVSIDNWLLLQDSAGDGTKNFAIYQGAANATRLLISTSGNVGIGTSSPGSKLEVNGNIRFTSETGGTLQFGSLGGPYRNITTETNASSGIDLAFYNSQGSNTNGAFVFRASDTSAKFMTIRNDGNVGIGTTSPSQSLDVVGNIQLKATAGNTTYLVIDSPVVTGGGSSILFRTGGVDKWVVLSYQTNNRLYIEDADSNDGVYMAQNTTSWVSNSDLRLKDVQGTITNALDKVQQLTGVKFKWKRESDNPDAKVRVGLIAQDVQAVLPEAVDDESPDLITDEETGRVSGGLGVRYTELVPLLVNAIKELTARVVTLEQAAA